MLAAPRMSRLVCVIRRAAHAYAAAPMAQATGSACASPANASSGAAHSVAFAVCFHNSANAQNESPMAR